MDDFDNTYAKWRRMMLTTSIILASLVLVVEIVMYFYLRQTNQILPDQPTYLFWFLYLPTTINVAVIVLGALAVRWIPAESEYINYPPLIQFSLLSLIAAGTHYVFPVTLCLFVFPIFMTIIFIDRKMTRRISILSVIFLAFALTNRRISPLADPEDTWFWSDTIVAFSVLTAAIIACFMLLSYQKELRQIINRGFIRQIEMQEQLHRDQKTGLFGHTILMNTLDNKVLQAEEEGGQVALAIFDIDNFKQINDSYGHLKGDEVISGLADFLKRNNPDKNLIARFGGDEFAILFAGPQVEHAHNFSESIRKGFAKLRFAFAEESLSISIGLAFWRIGLSTEDLIEKADIAMYAAKNAGKNQTVVIGSDSNP